MKNTEHKELTNAIIRFAGDSGDGIQLTGSMFTQDSAVLGHDVSTLPDFPAEIRAPAGTRAGVSSFQLNFSSGEVHTPGDRPHALIALNPAALAVHLPDLAWGGILILDDDSFTPAALDKAGYGSTDPREDGSLRGYELYRVPITSLTLAAVRPLGLGRKEATRCKNMFTLGLVAWLYDRSADAVLAQIDRIASRKKRRPSTREKYEAEARANKLALQAGYHYADTIEAFVARYTVGRAQLPPGTYRRVTGNEAIALGCLAASTACERPLFCASYPITPASEILQELSRLRHFGVRTVQAEDEIAAIGMAVGAAYGGSLGMTSTSGPGVALKSEAIGLAVMAELPVVIVNVQRGGPSTGLPTKTEQSDLLQAMFGRNGESPVVVLAPRSPADCFATALEAFRLAVRYMTPVLILSDGYLANGSEPWRIPEADAMPLFDPPRPVRANGFQPYGRDPETLARPWVVPGTPGLEHTIGGLEKLDGRGTVSYDAANHERMVHLRIAKIRGIARELPPLEVYGSPDADLLVLGWGSTHGAIWQAVSNACAQGKPVAAAHLKYLHPFPPNLGEVLRRYRRVLIPELNAGQLRLLIRAEYLVDAVGLSKISGLPFRTDEIAQRIAAMLGEGGNGRAEPAPHGGHAGTIEA